MKVQPTEVWLDLEAGKRITLIDVRTPAEFREVHIPGSRLMSSDRLDPEIVKSAEKNGETCVLVCRSGKRAEIAYQKLISAGCVDLRILDGGVTAWENEGFPVNSGKKTVSLERQVRIVAGFLVLSGVILGVAANPIFYGLSAFVGAGLIFAGITDTCGMAMILAKMPWNQAA
jgi:rhodanese-related sulfurtransferase